MDFPRKNYLCQRRARSIVDFRLDHRSILRQFALIVAAFLSENVKQPVGASIESDLPLAIIKNFSIIVNVYANLMEIKENQIIPSLPLKTSNGALMFFYSFSLAFIKCVAPSERFPPSSGFN